MNPHLPQPNPSKILDLRLDLEAGMRRHRPSSKEGEVMESDDGGLGR
jgi:hypothetical protein